MSVNVGYLIWDGKMTKGRVRVHVTKARNLYDAQIFGKQDVRCILTIGTKEQSTKVHQAGGTNPTWDESLEFDVDEGDDVCAVILERPKEPKNDLLGTCSINLSEWWEESDKVKKSFDKTYALTYGQKRRGELFLSIEATPAIQPLSNSTDVMSTATLASEPDSLNTEAIKSVQVEDNAMISPENNAQKEDHANAQSGDIASHDAPESEPSKKPCERMIENAAVNPTTLTSSEALSNKELLPELSASTTIVNEVCPDVYDKLVETKNEDSSEQATSTTCITEAKIETNVMINFVAGDKIEAKYKDKQKYYPGVISRAGAEGYYDINYDDGEKEYDVHWKLIRLVAKKSEILEPLSEKSPSEVNPSIFQLGDKVQVQYKGRDKLYPGKIARCRVNGTYDITYDDGEKETSVLPAFIHRKDENAQQQAVAAQVNVERILRIRAESGCNLNEKHGIAAMVDKKPDPYLIIHYDTMKIDFPVENDVDPVAFSWGKDAVKDFPWKEDLVEIELHVKDKDLIMDRYIGGTRLQMGPILAELLSMNKITRTIDLDYADEKLKVKKHRGQITLTFESIDHDQNHELSKGSDNPQPSAEKGETTQKQEVEDSNQTPMDLANAKTTIPIKQIEATNSEIPTEEYPHQIPNCETPTTQEYLNHAPKIEIPTSQEPPIPSPAPKSDIPAVDEPSVIMSDAHNSESNQRMEDEHIKDCTDTAKLTKIIAQEPQAPLNDVKALQSSIAEGGPAPHLLSTGTAQEFEKDEQLASEEKSKVSGNDELQTKGDTVQPHNSSDLKESVCEGNLQEIAPSFSSDTTNNFQSQLASSASTNTTSEVSLSIANDHIDQLTSVKSATILPVVDISKKQDSSKELEPVKSQSKPILEPEYTTPHQICQNSSDPLLAAINEKCCEKKVHDPANIASGGSTSNLKGSACTPPSQVPVNSTSTAIQVPEPYIPSNNVSQSLLQPLLNNSNSSSKATLLNEQLMPHLQKDFIGTTLKEAAEVKPDVHLEWKKMFELRYEEEVPVEKRESTVPRKEVIKQQPVRVQKKHIEGHVERMRKAHEIAIARELQDKQRKKEIMHPKKKLASSPKKQPNTSKVVAKTSPPKTLNYAQPTKSRLQKTFQESTKAPLMAEQVHESKKSFMKNALEDSLQGMTNAMHNAVTCQSSNNECQNVKAMWLLESELNGVIDAFLASTSEDSRLDQELSNIESPEEILIQKTFNCHLCMVEMAAHWCCDCTTALCAECLGDVGCQLEHHQVERIMPHNQSAIVFNKATDGDIPINSKASTKATFFREKTWIRLPLQFCSELSSVLATSKMHHASPKILKQFCLVLRKQIELSPTSKTVSTFLDRSRVSDWSADQLRCFLDVIHVSSTTFFKHQIDGPAFLKLPPVALHDTFLIHGSFQLHRCLFYRSLLVEMESYRTRNSLPNNLCHATKKQKKKSKDMPKPRSKQALKVSSSITSKPLPTHEEKPIVHLTMKTKPAATSRPTPKKSTPPPPFTATNDDDLLANIQNGIDDILQETFIESKEHSVPTKHEDHQNDISHLQTELDNLIHRYERLQGEDSAPELECLMLEAEESMQYLLKLSPNALLEAHKSMASFRRVISDIESAIKRHRIPKPETKVPVAMSLWTYEMPAPHAKALTTTTPGPADYHQTARYTVKAKRPVSASTARSTKPLSKKQINDEIAAFVHEETQRDSSKDEEFDSRHDPQLFDSSFISAKPNLSRWQTLRQKQAKPNLADTSTILADNILLNSTTPKSKKQTPQKPVPATAPVVHPVERVQDDINHHLEWAQRVQAQYAALS